MRLAYIIDCRGVAKEDHAFIVEVPELPECMADGKTVAEAVANVEIVIREWMEITIERVLEVPEIDGRGEKMNQKKQWKKLHTANVCFRRLRILCILSVLLALCTVSSAAAVSAAVKDKTIKVTISAAGDCTLGVDSRYNSIFNEYYGRHGSAYFLKKVKSIFSKDDVTIVNLEGTFTDSGNRADKTFTFKGPAAYVDILKKGSVEVVNTANNHTFDFGRQGYRDTIKTLKDNKIKYCRNSTIAYQKVKGVKIAFLGFNKLDGVAASTVKENIEKAKKKNADIIIVSFHWGIERSYNPDATQESLARCAIDNGAALVLGHHPHVLQGIERYKGRYIVYSLGNFCFGGNSNPSDKDTMIFQQTFSVVNHTVKKTKDIRVIPCSLSSVSYANDFQPKVLSGKEKSRLIEKINTMSAGRGVQFGADGKVK